MNDKFAYGPDVPAVAAGELGGYSGFRVRAPINAAGYFDEFLVFQGASYFRAVAKGQVYGLSARGLAVRTARAEREEFPYFTDFWIERPPEGATAIVIHALLQSPSVVGAYTFKAKPGEETLIDVDAALFPRVDLTAFGIAPLTSMFLFDSSNRLRFDDYRDAVHDSDGLQILNGRGERLSDQRATPLGGRGRHEPCERPGPRERAREALAEAREIELPRLGGEAEERALVVGIVLKHAAIDLHGGIGAAGGDCGIGFLQLVIEIQLGRLDVDLDAHGFMRGGGGLGGEVGVLVERGKIFRMRNGYRLVGVFLFRVELRREEVGHFLALRGQLAPRLAGVGSSVGCLPERAGSLCWTRVTNTESQR